MIGKLVGMLMGKKLKEQVVDTVLDKVDLPDPMEKAIKVAATGNMGELLGGAAKDELAKNLLKPGKKKK